VNHRTAGCDYQDICRFLRFYRSKGIAHFCLLSDVQSDRFMSLAFKQLNEGLCAISCAIGDNDPVACCSELTTDSAADPSRSAHHDCSTQFGHVFSQSSGFSPDSKPTQRNRLWQYGNVALL
jgi:hypothetical protein